MGSQLRSTNEMAFWTVQNQQTRPSRAKVSAWIILKDDLTDNLRHPVHHLPITDPVHNLALRESRAELVKSIKLEVVDRAIARVVRRQIERIWQDGAERAVESRHQIGL